MVEHGIWVVGVQTATIDSNWVFGVINSVDQDVVMETYFGWTGGITASDGGTITITNNIVAGSWHHGFHFTPDQCSVASSSDAFRNNVAHSISGYGAIAANVENDCTIVHYFTAYKVT